MVARNNLVAQFSSMFVTVIEGDTMRDDDNNKIIGQTPTWFSKKILPPIRVYQIVLWAKYHIEQ